MRCSCGNEKAWHKQSIYDKESRSWLEICDACGLEGGGEAIPDVYLERVGQTFDNLTDRMGKPIEIRSKRHKREVMDQLGVSEAGDRVNGAPYGYTSWIDGTRAWRKKQFDKDRPMIRELQRRYLERARSQ